VHGLEAEYWGRVDFVYLDIDNGTNGRLVRLYGGRSVPTFVVLAPDGALVGRWVGERTVQEMRDVLNYLLALYPSALPVSYSDSEPGT
jgi:thioredoxin-like negative regulator of GroEL